MEQEVSVETDFDLLGWENIQAMLTVDPTLDIPSVPLGNGGTPGCSIYRLREGIERFMISDINNPGRYGDTRGAAGEQSEFLPSRGRYYASDRRSAYTVLTGM